MPSSSEPRSLSPWIWLAPPFLFGVGLRLYGIQGQVLGGDEFHAIQIALRRPLERILTQYSAEADHSVPLTGILRLISTAGVQLSELVLRMPALLLGFVLLWAAPRRCATFLGHRTGAIFAWLLAASPLLVLYSRLVRSYMPMVCLALIAAFAFYAWLEKGRWWDALLYVATSALATYFHLLAAPFVLAPFLFAIPESLRRRRTMASPADRSGSGRAGGYARTWDPG